MRYNLTLIACRRLFFRLPNLLRNWRDTRSWWQGKIHQTCLKFGFKWLFTEALQKYPLWDKGDKAAGEGSWRQPQKGHLGTAQGSSTKIPSVLITSSRLLWWTAAICYWYLHSEALERKTFVCQFQLLIILQGNHKKKMHLSPGPSDLKNVISLN